jgi:uncharacterized membrane protein YkoI
MKTNLLRSAPALALTISLTSCAPSTHAIRQEAHEEPEIHHASDLKGRMAELIEKDSSITDEQKSRLMSLVDRSSAKGRELQTRMNQSKSLLMKELLSQNYSKKRADAIVHTLQRISNQQLSNTIASMEEAKEILGRRQNSEVYMDKLLEAGGR